MSDDELRAAYDRGHLLAYTDDMLESHAKWAQHDAGLRAVADAAARTAREDSFNTAIALALQHVAAAKRTDDAASSLRLLVAELRARAEGGA